MILIVIKISDLNRADLNRPTLLIHLLTFVCCFSGADKDVAKRLLEACAWNLEMAIGMHMDGGETTGQPSPSGSQAPQDPEYEY